MYLTTTPSMLMCAILFLLSIFPKAAAKNNELTASSISQRRFLDKQIAPARKTADLKACFDLCKETPGCGSANYNLFKGVCECNSKNHSTHPHNLVEKEGYVYLPVHMSTQKHPTQDVQQAGSEPTEPKYKTCAKIKEMKPSSPSGVYELEVNGVPKSVYCDMDNYGGGWSLVVSISGSNNQHTLRTENNCLNSSFCVPLTTGTLVARKRSDSDIRSLASYEGTFRIDVMSTSAVLYKKFYRLSQGAQVFDSGCMGSGCPRIIVSPVYPYVWESNCKGIEKGYQISRDTCFHVFDEHDSGECGSGWGSSKYHTERVLYGFCSGSYTGMFSGLQGYMFVR